jgi:hypothetical protein
VETNNLPQQKSARTKHEAENPREIPPAAETGSEIWPRTKPAWDSTYGGKTESEISLHGGPAQVKQQLEQIRLPVTAAHGSANQKSKRNLGDRKNSRARN